MFTSNFFWKLFPYSTLILNGPLSLKEVKTKSMDSLHWFYDVSTEVSWKLFVEEDSEVDASLVMCDTLIGVNLFYFMTDCTVFYMVEKITWTVIEVTHIFPLEVRRSTCNIQVKRNGTRRHCHQCLLRR